MKTIFALTFVLLLSACVSVPVEHKFPAVPKDLTQQCPKLQEVPADTTKLSDVLMIVTNNYALYHECSLKVDTWNEWYKTNKEIY